MIGQSCSGPGLKRDALGENFLCLKPLSGTKTTTVTTPDPSDLHQREIEHGIQIIVTPQLGSSEAWTRVRLAA